MLNIIRSPEYIYRVTDTYLHHKHYFTTYKVLLLLQHESNESCYKDGNQSGLIVDCSTRVYIITQVLSTESVISLTVSDVTEDVGVYSQR